MRPGARLLAQLGVGHGEVEVRLGEVGLQRDGLLEEPDGARVVAALDEKIREVVGRLGLRRVGGHRAAVEGLGLVAVALEEPQVAEVGDGRREARVEGDGLAVWTTNNIGQVGVDGRVTLR